MTVTVAGANDGPDAKDDTAAASENGAPVTIAVLANDTDTDAGTTLTVCATYPVREVPWRLAVGSRIRLDGSPTYRRVVEGKEERSPPVHDGGRRLQSDRDRIQYDERHDGVLRAGPATGEEVGVVGKEPGAQVGGQHRAQLSGQGGLARLDRERTHGHEGRDDRTLVALRYVPERKESPSTP